MQIGYVVPDLTHLRYYIPFSRRASLTLEATNTFLLLRGNAKYNGLANDDNCKKCVELIKRYCPKSKIADDQFSADLAVQVERGWNNRRDIDAKRRISLSHGFDYTFQRGEPSGVDAYLCSSDLSAQHAASFGVQNVLTTPFPVCLWSMDELFSESGVWPRSVTLFYPDVGDTDIAGSIVDSLIEKGFTVFVKQRRKHQKIRCGGTHVYDDVWYPSEAIVFPIATDVTIGFGSSAYVDLVPAGVRYINVDIHSMTSPWNSFAHFEDANYTRLTDASTAIDETIKLAVDSSTRIRKILPVAAIDEFLKRIVL